MSDAIPRVPVRTLTPAPYLRVSSAARAIQFYTTVFSAVEIVRLVEPSGRVAHAELRMGAAGDASLMLSDEYPEFGLVGPQDGRTPVALQLYVNDVAAICALATAAGGTVRAAPALDPFGDRTAKLLDPCGHEWIVATRVEEITVDEMRRRFTRLMNFVDNEFR